MHSHAPKYRPDFDGLRAVAVVGVLLYHIDPTWLSSGYVGVDVFFVTCGFLITSVCMTRCILQTCSKACFGIELRKRPSTNDP